jgi:hypothetical protein
MMLPGLVAGASAPGSDEIEAATSTGCHSIELSLGLLNAGKSSAVVSTAGVVTEASQKGLLGSLRYAYWVDRDLAVQVSVGVLNADVSTSVNGGGVVVQSATVVPLIFGLKYQLFSVGGTTGLRPYGYAGIGPYLGFASDVSAGTTTGAGTRWEAALGGRLAAGLDLSLSRLFALGFQVGYLAMTDFETAIGSERNYSGPEFSLSLILTLGG